MEIYHTSPLESPRTELRMKSGGAMTSTNEITSFLRRSQSERMAD